MINIRWYFQIYEENESTKVRVAGRLECVLVWVSLWRRRCVPLHVILNLSCCVQSYTLFVVIVIQIDYSKGKYLPRFNNIISLQCYRVHIYICESPTRKRIKIKRGSAPLALMNVGKHEDTPLTPPFEFDCCIMKQRGERGKGR